MNKKEIAQAVLAELSDEVLIKLIRNQVSFEINDGETIHEVIADEVSKVIHTKEMRARLQKLLKPAIEKALPRMIAGHVDDLYINYN